MDWMIPVFASAAIVCLGLYLVERRAATRLILSERKRHVEEIERMTKLYDRLVETAGASTRAQVEALARLVTTGQPTAIEARTEQRDADPRETLGRIVSEQTVQHGVNALREAYRALGREFSDADLREEVEALLSGIIPPSLPAEPAPVVRAEATA